MQANAKDGIFEEALLKLGNSRNEANLIHLVDNFVWIVKRRLFQHQKNKTNTISTDAKKANFE